MAHTYEPFDYVYTHINCSDGKAARWVARTYAPQHGNTEFLEMEPGAPITDYEHISGKNILMLDYMASNLDDVLAVANLVVVMDHHKGNVKLLKEIQAKDHPNLMAIFDMNRCALQIAWDEFVKPEYGSNTIEVEAPKYPWFVTVIADRDLWVWTRKDSLAIGKYLSQTYWNNNDIYTELLTWTPEQIKNAEEQGKKILEREEKQINWMVKSTIITKCVVDGIEYKVALTTGNKMLVSEVGHALCESKVCDFAAIWSYNLLTDIWKVSLRSTKDGPIDVDMIASKLAPGGGGHQSSSGMKIRGGRGLRECFDIPIKEE